ncbi:GrpB family protein [Dyadobacter sp. CY312]|uniref:GrpB family protein n=1 Tax=Dyadobacter sp. CY312 TaxID=2907303 RepID=UPI001F3C784A|nr:GrpB family protein [Dyadobacter sp. CY312]MCE7040955.1 GrpB family protein [Dyadobacter sp. CY312]
MKPNLKELKKDDWNTLFPIELSDHNPAWKTIFDAEKQRILSGVGDNTVWRIEHFGSSSIPLIKAKPYIDILIEIPQELLFNNKLIQQFENLDYTYFKVPERDSIAAYMSFGKGYKLSGEKEQIFHIHMCPKENVMWSQIKFRDYLREHQERAQEYESLKVKLAAQFRNDRGAYLLGKADFINETMALIQS